MSPVWLARMARWARRPPSRKQLRLIALVVAAVLALALLDRAIPLQDWLSQSNFAKGRFAR